MRVEDFQSAKKEKVRFPPRRGQVKARIFSGIVKSVSMVGSSAGKGSDTNENLKVATSEEPPPQGLNHDAQRKSNGAGLHEI